MTIRSSFRDYYDFVSNKYDRVGRNAFKPPEGV